jgi:hypothetical protein
MRDRLRQRAIVSLLRTHDGPPSILATQIFFLFDEKPFLSEITDNMTSEAVVVEVGKSLRSKQRFHEDVTAWARNLFEQAGLPFKIKTFPTNDRRETDPLPSLSAVHSQPTAPKAPPTSPKRKTRRVYLDLAIQYLEKGSCTHKELVDAIMKQFPNLNRETVSTFVSDVQNPRYSPIKDRKVVKQADGKLIFEDKIKPMLTVIENPNYAGTKNEAEPVTEKQVSGSDV